MSLERTKLNPLPADCRCITWEREASDLFPRHHPHCPHYDPADGLPINISNYFAKLPTGAVFGGYEREYRFMLWRTFDPSKPALNLIGLNPSKAGTEKNDPTITRELTLARMNGFGSIIKTNLFAFVSTDPKALEVDNVARIIGPPNDLWIDAAAQYGRRVAICWGVGGALHARAHDVATRILAKYADKVYCFGTTKAGFPRHTARLPYSCGRLVRFTGAL